MKERIFGNIDFDSFFDKWYDEYESSDNFEDYMWHSMDTEVEEYKLENPNLTEKEYSQWEEKELKKNARKWFDSHIEEWEDQIESKLKIENNKAYVYRCITVNVDLFMDSIKNNTYMEGFNG